MLGALSSLRRLSLCCSANQPRRFSLHPVVRWNLPPHQQKAENRAQALQQAHTHTPPAHTPARLSHRCRNQPSTPYSAGSQVA